jgi:hypothetical protein
MITGTLTQWQQMGVLIGIGLAVIAAAFFAAEAWAVIRFITDYVREVVKRERRLHRRPEVQSWHRGR